MANTGYGFEALGIVYAQALVNEAQKQNALADVTDDVRGIGELLRTNAAFAAFAQAPSIDAEKRVESINKIFSGRVHPLTLSLLQSLARRERLIILDAVVDGFESILKKASGVVDVEVTSATPLSDQSLERVRAAVGKSLGKTAEMTARVDASLVGGMTLRIEDMLIDGSVATQLEKIRQQLRVGGLSKLQKNQAAFI